MQPMLAAAAGHPDRTALAQGLTVRSSAIHGRGLFTRSALPPRRKLGEISGQLVPLPQARIAVENQPAIYLIELDDRCALDCSAGNHFRHLNHSCTPNCYLRVQRKRVEVYSLTAIPAGTELTVDYGVTPHVGGMTCRCGAAKCRARL